MDDFERYRPLLFSIAYRMTGSAMDAEDIVQETFVRYQAVPSEEVQSPKAYLSAIVTRLSLNHLALARVQRETYLGPWLPEPMVEARPEITGLSRAASESDSISMAFMVLLESLTPAERAVFILREVFGYPYEEIADMLDKTESACRKLFSRAKSFVAANRPRFRAKPEEHRRLLEQFIVATSKGDFEGLTSLLAEEATMWADGGGKARGAATRPVSGREAVAQFVLGVSARFTPPNPQVSITDVNGLPALLVRDAQHIPVFIVSIETGDGRIQKIWVTANPDKLKGIA